MPRTVVIIPARMESERFPNKPLADIQGKPLVVRTWDAAYRSRYANMTWVATDSAAVAQAIQERHGNVIMTSPAHDNGTERCAWAGLVLGLDANDVVINLQGDSPLTPPEYLDAVRSGLEGDCEVATLVAPTHGRPQPGDVFAMMNHRWEAMYFDRNPDLPHSDVQGDLYRHIGIYAYRMQALMKYIKYPKGPAETNAKLEQLRWLERGVRIKCVEVPHAYPEVNYPADVERVAEALNDRVNIRSRLREPIPEMRPVGNPTYLDSLDSRGFKHN